MLAAKSGEKTPYWRFVNRAANSIAEGRKRSI